MYVQMLKKYLFLTIPYHTYFFNKVHVGSLEGA